ncbi:hypothetical protein MTR67_031867 [Solanum verrucosum]|uniref:Uncharacterized protein n=1 Tax=Solanum verrucosum TaxID=315347 RepID=A0AAF0U372_SOLVR|nr:hypothetical protein MTR67_031867 [Solanum verrucosum]
MLSVHGRHDRKLIVLNKAGRPVGPSNDVVIELSSFLGFVLDTKQDLWDYTKEKEGETNDTPSLKEFFVVTRKRKPNRSYKDTNEDIASKIAEMENIEMQQNEDGNETIDAFASVMGSEHPRSLRLYGRGVTKTTLKGKVGNFEASSNATNDLVKKMEDRILRMEEKIEEQREI